MQTSYKFKTAPQLRRYIDDYFIYIKGEPQPAISEAATNTRVSWLREPEPPTLSNLALYLGFTSMDEYKKYETSRNYGKHFRYAKLRIAAVYEQLLFEKPTATIFALKNMGWPDKQITDELLTSNILKVEMTNIGPKPAGNEKEVDILL